MLIYADRRISPFEGGWGDVLFKRCDVLFKRYDILFTKCNILKAFTNRYIIPILMLVYTDRRISPFEGGLGGCFI